MLDFEEINLNKIKNAEIIKYKKGTPGHKELLNLFNELLDIILTDKTLESESQKDENKNENEKVENEDEKLKEEKENENENEDDDDDIIKILILSNEYAETKIKTKKI